MYRFVTFPRGHPLLRQTAREVVGTTLTRLGTVGPKSRVLASRKHSPSCERFLFSCLCEGKRDLVGSGTTLQEQAGSLTGQVLPCSQLMDSAALLLCRPPSFSNVCPFPAGCLFGSRRGGCRERIPGIGPPRDSSFLVGDGPFGKSCIIFWSSLDAPQPFAAPFPATADHSRQWPCVDPFPQMNARRCFSGMKLRFILILQFVSLWRSRMTPRLLYGVVKRELCSLNTLDFPARTSSRREARQASLRERTGMQTTPISGAIGGVHASQDLRGSAGSPSPLWRLWGHLAPIVPDALKRWTSTGVSLVSAAIFAGTMPLSLRALR
eukprot:2311203-Amphidinium_carterae.1